MDDALVQVVIDAGGRAWFSGQLPSRRYTHWLRSFSTAAECTLHVRVLRGADKHHVIEAAFKALGLALRQALRDDGAVFSTKGRITWEELP
jgi:imidazoleglycerol-phosphate dehydratase